MVTYAGCLLNVRGKKGTLALMQYYLFIFQKNRCWSCFSVASVFCLFFFGLEACRILAPGPGTEPITPALGGEGSTTEPPGSPWRSVIQWGPQTSPVATSVFQWPPPSSRMPVLSLWCLNLDPCAWVRTHDLDPWFSWNPPGCLCKVTVSFRDDAVAEGGEVLESLQIFHSSYYENFHSKSRAESYDGPHSLTKIY